ncbi:quinone oxidoreductase family protein [Microlunatus speluncae]|uniref:quinone oxidoreductase family protein n=1 Tax=Microlunatus speluncae TaxID=2594267 RepID=UPI0012667FF6|nr:quinone oxidoreductase [Microlunatus speluncae]
MGNAIQYRAAGGPEVLELVELPDAEPGPGEVAIDVTGVGVNFIEIYQRTGVYPVPFPYTPGGEGAGVISALGPDVTTFKIGDRVAWPGIPRSYASRVVGPADKLLAVPGGLSDEQAAALPLQGLTAHYLATSTYPIQAGDTVLVHAGAGGVGLLLTQIAKIKGARVITTVSTGDKAELSREAGADEVIVGYTGFAERARELTDGAGLPVVYDSVGKDTFDDSLAAVRRRGILVLFGASSGAVPAVDPQRLNDAGSVFLTRPKLGDHTVTRSELLERSAELFGWVRDGRLKVRIGGTYPLAEAAQAQADLAARKTTGKLILIP